MTSLPASYNGFRIITGGTFNASVILSGECAAPYDLTGCTARMDCKYKISDATPFLTMSTANGRITIDPLIGKLTITAPADVTSALTPSRAMYDIQVTYPNDDVVYYLQGQISVEESVTP